MWERGQMGYIVLDKEKPNHQHQTDNYLEKELIRNACGQAIPTNFSQMGMNGNYHVFIDSVDELSFCIPFILGFFFNRIFLFVFNY